MAQRAETLWDMIRGAIGGNEEQSQETPTIPYDLGQSYSSGQGAEYNVPKGWNSQFSDRPEVPSLQQTPESARQTVDMSQQSIVNAEGMGMATPTPTAAPWDMAKTPNNTTGGEYVAPEEEQGFMSKMGDGIGDWFGNEENIANLAIGLNSMRLNPDAGLAKAMESKLTSIRKNKESSKTVAWLRQNATPKNQYAMYADLIEKNPSMASEFMKKAMGIGAGGQKTSAVMTDPTTGQQYVVKTDPSTGNVTKVDVKGAKGDTYTDKQNIESDIRLREQDTKDAYDASQDAFQTANEVNKNVRDLYSMLPLLDQGAESGLLRQFTPAFEANTAQLRSLGNTMGINVINMATFGALSEKELNLALKTAIDMSLPPAELRKQILAKIDAQEKLKNELYKRAQTLSSGSIGYQEYINQESKAQERGHASRYNALNANEKGSVTPEQWMGMNLDKREAFIGAR